MSLADALTGRGIDDDFVSWEVLTDSFDLKEEALVLEPALLGELAGTVGVSWVEMAEDDRADAVELLANRLKEINDPFQFRSTVSIVVAGSLSCDSPEPASAAHDGLIPILEAVVDASNPDQQSLRAAPTLEALCDLIVSSRVSDYQLVALLDRIRSDPPEYLGSSIARSAGRLAESKNDPLFEQVINSAAKWPSAFVDAAIESGHLRLREAFGASTGEVTLGFLHQARQNYSDALDQDPGRPDARSFRAAIDLLLAFAASAGPETLEGPTQQLKEALSEFSRYDEPGAGPSRSMRLSAGWWSYIASLRGASETIHDEHNLDLCTGLGLLIDAYAESRARLVEGGTGLMSFIGVPVGRWLSENQLATKALEDFASRLPKDSEAFRAADEILAEQKSPLGKERRFRFQPGSPGG